MAGLFISYRRDDSQSFAGRLAHDLSRVLSDEPVFSDIEIPPVRDFSDVLHRPGVAPVRAQRLRSHRDRGRIRARHACVAVLVGGAAMPAPDTLPPGLQRLTRLKAWTMRDRHWDADLALLLPQLHPLVPAMAPAAAHPKAILNRD